MRRFGVAILFVVAVACAGPEQRYVELPDLGASARTLIVFSERDSGAELEAIDLADWSGRLDVDTDEVRRLQLLVYREDLHALGWPKGALRRAEATDCARAPLSEPASRFVLEVRDDESELVRASGMPGELAGVELEALCPCRTAEVSAFQLDLLGRARQIARRGEGYLLQTTYGVYELSNTFEVITSTVGIFLERMYVDASQTGWISGDGGRVYRWPMNGDFEVALDAPELGTIERIGPAGTAGELILITREGLYLWSGGTPRLLQASVPRVGSSQLSVLATLPSGASVVGLYRNQGLLRRPLGSELVEALAWSSDLDPPQHLEHIPALGLVLSARTTRVFRSEDEGAQWTDLTPGEPTRQLSESWDFVAFERGFLELGRSGIRQYAPSSGYCPTMRFGEGVDMRSGTILDDGRLLIVSEPTEDDRLSADAYLVAFEGRPPQ